MTKEQLKNLGLDDEQIAEVMRLKGLEITAREEEIERLKEQAEATRVELEALQGEDIEGIKAKAEELSEKYEALKTLQEEQELTRKIEEHISKKNFRSAKAIVPLLDREALKNSKDFTTDIETALNQIAEEFPFQLNDDEGGTGGSKGNAPKKGSSEKNPYLTDDKAEQQELILSDPDKAARLMREAKEKK